MGWGHCQKDVRVLLRRVPVQAVLRFCISLALGRAALEVLGIRAQGGPGGEGFTLVLDPYPLEEAREGCRYRIRDVGLCSGTHTFCSTGCEMSLWRVFIADS